MRLVAVKPNFTGRTLGPDFPSNGKTGLMTKPRETLSLISLSGRP